MRYRNKRVATDAVWQAAGSVYQVTRSLDETYYPSLTSEVLERRNEQQVVTRECKKHAEGSTLTADSRPILMIKQAWIWLIDDVVVYAYVPEGHYPAYREYFDVHLGSRMERIIPEREFPELEVSAFLSELVSSLEGTTPRKTKIYPPTLNIFETGVVSVLTDVNKYLEDNDLATEDSSVELELLDSVADIRDELAMIDEILREQDQVLDEFVSEVNKSLKARVDAHSIDPRRIKELAQSRDIESAKATIKQYRERVAKIDRDAERADKTVQDRLNVKRTFASIRDSRASMSDAKTSLLLAIAVIGFTVITVLFAPLAFMTALFALNIDELQKHKKGEGDDAYYPSWYIFVTFCR